MELKILHTKPIFYQEGNDEFPFPSMIGAGNGESIVVSKKVDETIVKVADQLMLESSNLRSQTTQRATAAEWRAQVRNAFGPALLPVDLDADPAESAKVVLDAVREQLDRQVSSLGVMEFGFGCTLFGNTDIQPFSIGPVQFEPRLAWLERKKGEGEVSVTSHRRIERSWEGEKLRKRKSSFDSIREQDILEVIGGCAFVCSVKIDGFAPEAAREKALTVARLAMVSIALLWRIPSQPLEGMNLSFDRKIHKKKALSFIPGKVILAGSRLSHMPHGPWLKAGDWEKIFNQYSNRFQVVARVLDYVVNPKGSAPQSNMMNTLTQALLWFHEGCREPGSLIAVVKFSAALDTLSCGGKAGGICRLINARLGIQNKAPIRPGGPTLQDAIKEVYGEGRSRTIHGTNDKIGHDWTGTRTLAEQFSALTLCACIDWVAKNPSSDDPKALGR